MVSTYLEQITANRNTIRAKLVELGMAASSDKLDKLAAAIEALVNQGAVQVQLREGETYTIPAGYHNGTGTVMGVSGGGSYELQTKTVTPTKNQQSITPDAGYYGLSGVTVAAIPEAYHDVSSVTLTEDGALTGKIFVTADGTVKTGTMADNGAVSKTLDATSITYTIPKGYHNGNGTVKIVLETKTVTPTKSQQKITPTAGKILSEVTVEPIPDNFIDTSGANATAGTILIDNSAYVDGEKVDGSMPNNGAISETIDGLTKTSVDIPKGYTDGGTVSLTNDIETALAAI